jgi:hypothetical protein
MMDDSLSDTIRTETSLLMPVPVPQSDQALIAELKRRGFKVYPEKRVRIYSSQHMIDRRAIYQLRSMDSLDHLRQSVDRRSAHAVGQKLMEEGALVRSREDALHQPGMEGEIRRMQVCVVLPNDWDFEAEMWGMRS